MATEEDSYDAVTDSPLGLLGIRLDGDALAGIDFLAGVRPQPEMTTGHSPDAQPFLLALESYFLHAGNIKHIKISLQGTEFQKKVWRLLQQIPVGQTRTYGELATLLGTSPRAVGNACRHNPVPICVPCHRVVAANGDGGFMGAIEGQPMSIKRWLLQHERRA